MALKGTAFTKQDLKLQAKSCGSPYFSPGSMRFFNARLLAVFPVPGKNMTYFVEAKGGDKGRGFTTIPRHYQIGVFKNCRVESIGKGIGRGKQTGVYTSSRAAKKVAAAIAKKASGGGATKIRRRRR